MPRWRLAAFALAVVSLGHSSVAVLGVMAQRYLAHDHGHAHADPGRAAEHGHHHHPSVTAHGHEATIAARASGPAPPGAAGLWEAARTSAQGPTSAAFAPGFRRGSGCDPPPIGLRNPILRI